MNRRFSIIGVVIFVLALSGALQSAPARALNFVGGSVTLTCTDVTINMTYSTNRDNTGTGAEHYGYIVTDGGGTTIYSELFTDIGFWPDSWTEPYSPAPASNPITARFLSFAGNGLPEVVYYTTSYNCPGLTQGSFSGPGIPSGFVLKTITCSVAVYDTPGGKPVGSDAIKAGQTWFVNPTPVKGPDGKSWTEVFVAGSANAFIPTSCVR